MPPESASPKVQLARSFLCALQADGADPAVLVEAFAEWKSNWPEWEDHDYYFGKDAAYLAPKRAGRSVLRHVHMPPEDPAHWPAHVPALSEAQREKIISERVRWDVAWSQERAARYRTSSRVLVYVDGGRHGFLLLHLAREPEGHDETTANLRLMQRWADVAEAFIHDGSILL